MKAFSCEVNNNVVVKEYKAPTDDSIRIYNELKEKAIESILDHGSESLSCDSLSWTIFKSPEIQGFRINFSLLINGRNCKGNIDIRTKDILYRYRDVKDVCDEIKTIIHREIVNFISSIISQDLMKEIAGRVSYCVLGEQK